MALKTSLSPVVKKIAAAVQELAASRGCPRDDYVLVGSWDRKTDRIRLVFGTDCKIDEREWYAGIFESLQHAFSGEPWLTRNIGLVVENVQSLDDVYGHFSTDDDEFDLTEMIERS